MTSFDDKVKFFLAQHPQVLVGHEAWQAANNDVADPNDTYTAIGKPLPNVVLLQTVCATTDKALVAAAFVDDDEAEAHFRAGGGGATNAGRVREVYVSGWQLRCLAAALFCMQVFQRGAVFVGSGKLRGKRWEIGNWSLLWARRDASACLMMRNLVNDCNAI